MFQTTRAGVDLDRPHLQHADEQMGINYAGRARPNAPEYFIEYYVHSD
jgi:hypothetical protein